MKQQEDNKIIIDLFKNFIELRIEIDNMRRLNRFLNTISFILGGFVMALCIAFANIILGSIR